MRPILPGVLLASILGLLVTPAWGQGGGAASQDPGGLDPLSTQRRGPIQPETVGTGHRGDSSAPEELDSVTEAVELPPSQAAAGLEETPLEPRYVLEGIVVRGNRKTRTAIILGELGLQVGDVVTPTDRRVTRARVRLLSLGFFIDVRLSLVRGSRRGAAILNVDIQERGTIIINGLFLGTSEATALWGGLDAAETNFLGRGILLSGGFVQSTTPTVPGAIDGSAARAQIAVPLGPDGLVLSLGGLYSRGSEFYRAFGESTDVAPLKHVATEVRRTGGRFGVASAMGRTTRLGVDARVERLVAILPDLRTQDLGAGRSRPIDFGIAEGDSRLVTVAMNLDIDSRDDPILPRAGRRFLFSLETGLAAFGSHYRYAKGVVQHAQYLPVGRRGHALSVHLLAGAIYGEAPHFEQFFISDLNVLLPARALGLNFSSLPARNLIGGQVAQQRYAEFAGRVMVEYAIPLWRGRGFFYRADAFTGLGIYGLASEEDLRYRDRPLSATIPVGLTADLGLRLDTLIGIFNFTVGNLMSRLPY